MSSSSDPTEELSYLKAASGPVKRLGSESVRGVPTTHYVATIQYSLYPRLVPASQRYAARESVAAIERITGQRSQTVNVWVDDTHHVKRESYVIQECVPNSAAHVKISATIEFLDYGVQVIPAPPPNSEVEDVTSKVVSELDKAKKGQRRCV